MLFKERNFELFDKKLKEFFLIEWIEISNLKKKKCQRFNN